MYMWKQDALYTASIDDYYLEMSGLHYSKAKMFNRTSAVHSVPGLYTVPAECVDQNLNSAI